MLRSGHSFHSRHTRDLSKTILYSMDRHRSAVLSLRASERAFVLAANLWEQASWLMPEQALQASALLLTMLRPGGLPVFQSQILSERAYWSPELASLPERRAEPLAGPLRVAHHSEGTAK